MAIAPTTSPPFTSVRTGPATLTPPGGYYVFYDAQCRLCARSRRTIERLRPTADVTFVNVQDPAAMEPFPMVDRAAGLRQMFVLDPAGRLAGGYDGFVSLLPALRLLRPLRHAMRLPPVRAAGRRVYAWVARNRYRLGGRVSCEDGACRLP
jgi:predicted DCC family thiol-disulfide oxidoreductase YuxK